MCLLKKILGESRNLLACNILELYGSQLALLCHYMYMYMYITLITVNMYMYITLISINMYMYITLNTVYMYMTLLYSITWHTTHG